jgi:tetrahydromethanopterin S-methyltransferase subunit G
MEAMAQEWTEGRLDELSGKVDRGFGQVDKRFEQVDKRFEQVDKRFEKVEREIVNLRVETRTEFTELRAEMKEGFARTDARLDGIQKTMIQGAIAIAAAMLTGFSAILVLIATQT